MLLACKDHRNRVDLIGLAFEVVGQLFRNLFFLAHFRRILYTVSTCRKGDDMETEFMVKFIAWFYPILACSD